MDESLVAKYPDLERQHFWWATRRKLVTDLITDLGEPNEMEILDVGCGSGMTARSLAETGATVTGIDLETHGGPGEEPVSLVEGDYLEESSGLGQFDVVLALDAIEHFAEEGDVMRALASNVVPGGCLIVTVPAFRFLWTSHDVTNQHYRRYTVRTLRRALTGVGLQVDRIGYLFMLLTIPKLILSVLERLTQKSAPAGTNVSSWPNRLAGNYFGLETRIAASRRNFLPCGTSVVAVASRPA